MMRIKNQGTVSSEQESARMAQFLRDSLTPIGDSAEPARDLWPAMLRRMDEQADRGAASIPWFDWALAGGLVAFAAIAPRTIPVILYYL